MDKYFYTVRIGVSQGQCCSYLDGEASGGYNCIAVRKFRSPSPPQSPTAGRIPRQEETQAVRFSVRSSSLTDNPGQDLRNRGNGSLGAAPRAPGAWAQILSAARHEGEGAARLRS